MSKLLDLCEKIVNADAGANCYWLILDAGYTKDELILELANHYFAANAAPWEPTQAKSSEPKTR